MGGTFALSGGWLQQSKQDRRDAQAYARKLHDEKRERLRLFFETLIRSVHAHWRLMSELFMYEMAPAVGRMPQSMSDSKRDELHRQMDEVYPDLGVRLALEEEAKEIAILNVAIFQISGSYVDSLDGPARPDAKKSAIVYDELKLAIAKLESAVRFKLDELDKFGAP